MSEVWSEGYFTDVGYTFGYYREIRPVFQRFCLLLRGFAASETADGNHCELGFGQGVSVNIHAAANPGHYIATDFNPAHATHANTLAKASGCGARLLDDSFEQLLNRSDLPQFDSISLHGIWTWVSRDNQKIIAEFAHRYLKPGGTFYISYNCFPGWSPTYPLRQLFALHDRFAATPHSAKERVDAALKFSEALLEAKPLYAKTVPQLSEHLKMIMGQDRHYLAHEYFNREWNCMYFTDVVDALAPAKLEYACSADPLDTVNTIQVDPEGQIFLNGIEHPILREQARDYFVNQKFRRDLYVRGSIRLSESEQREALLAMHFVLIKPPEEIALKVKGAIGEATLQETVNMPVIEALASQDYAPKTLRDIAARVPNLGYAQLREVITVLVGMGAVDPCHPKPVRQMVRSQCDALNRHLMGRARFTNEIQTLASPVTGGGVTVGRFAQLFLLAEALGHKQPAEWAHFTWQLLAAQGQRIIKEGETLESVEANLAELTAQATTFRDKQLPLLKALQVA